MTALCMVLMAVVLWKPTCFIEPSWRRCVVRDILLVQLHPSSLSLSLSSFFFSPPPSLCCRMSLILVPVSGAFF